jgi:hypothetical protein
MVEVTWALTMARGASVCLAISTTYTTDAVFAWFAYSSPVGSKLATGAHGELLVVVTTPSPRLPVGAVFVALGNQARSIEDGWRWLGQSKARPPTPDERVEAETGHGSPRLPA